MRLSPAPLQFSPGNITRHIHKTENNGSQQYYVSLVIFQNAKIKQNWLLHIILYTNTLTFSSFYIKCNISHLIASLQKSWEVRSLKGTILNVNPSHKDPGSPLRNHKEFCEIIHPQTSQSEDVLDRYCQTLPQEKRHKLTFHLPLSNLLTVFSNFSHFFRLLYCFYYQIFSRYPHLPE